MIHREQATERPDSPAEGAECADGTVHVESGLTRLDVGDVLATHAELEESHTAMIQAEGLHQARIDELQRDIEELWDRIKALQRANVSNETRYGRYQGWHISSMHARREELQEECNELMREKRSAMYKTRREYNRHAQQHSNASQWRRQTKGSQSASA